MIDWLISSALQNRRSQDVNQLSRNIYYRTLRLITILILIIIINNLKGVFVKNEKRYIALRRKIIAFDATNLTSICCVFKRRKLLKTTDTEECMFIQIQKVAIYDLDRKKINLISKKSFRYYNLSSSNIFRSIRIFS